MPSLLFGHADNELGTGSWLRNEPNATSVFLHDLFNNGESDPRSLCLVPAFEALEDRKNFVVVLWFNPGSVVFDAEFIALYPAAVRQPDVSIFPVVVLEGIANQVRKELVHLGPVRPDFRPAWLHHLSLIHI